VREVISFKPIEIIGRASYNIEIEQFYGTAVFFYFNPATKDTVENAGIFSVDKYNTQMV